MPGLASLLENYDDILPERACTHKGSDIPSYLKGTMLRNGPGIFEWGDSKYTHWFDGDAYIQRYAFRDGKMFYSARAIETSNYLKNKQANRIITGAFGTKAFADPCKTIFERISSAFEPVAVTDNTNVAFQDLGDMVFALTETPRMVPISTETLDVANTVEGKDTLFAVHTSTAHCHYDNEGNVYNIGSRYGKQTQYVIVKMSPKKGKPAKEEIPFNADLIAEVNVDSAGPAYYHSFGMSENYFILIESPLRFDMKYMMMNQIYRMFTYNSCMTWLENTNTAITVVDKRTGRKVAVKIESEPFFIFHHANSYEKDGFLVCDYSKFKRVNTLGGILLEDMRKPDFFKDKDTDLTPYLHRMIVPLSIPIGARPGDNLLKDLPWAGGCKAELKADGSLWVVDERMSEHSFEFARFNYDSFNTKDYRYVYGTNVLKAEHKKKNAIVKLDLRTKKSTLWEVDNLNQLAAEPIFIADPDRKEEDDGVLTVAIMTLDGSNPYVVVLDARNLKEIARFVLPTDRIPFGFHSHYTTKRTQVQKKIA